MRVFYDHQVTSLQDAGGISRYYLELVRALMAVGEVDATLLLGLHNSVLPFESLRPAAHLVASRTTLPPGFARYGLNEAWTAGLAPFFGRFDVYHATYQRALPWPRRQAVVATHHDSTPDQFPALFRNADSIHRRLAKLYARADRILCISASSQADLLHYFNIDPTKTVVIHHGFTPLAAAESGTQPGSQADLQADSLPRAPYLLFAGARAAYKNFPMVLEALARQPGKDLQLVVAGGGVLTASEQAIIDRLKLQRRVHLLTRPTDGQLAAAYRGAALFLYPSLYEGFGFPPLDAMAAGCPALVSNTSALPEICGDAAFYFDPDGGSENGVDELAQQITNLLNDDRMRLSKRESGFARIRNYTWSKAAAQTLAVYRAALDSTSR